MHLTHHGLHDCLLNSKYAMATSGHLHYQPLIFNYSQSMNGPLDLLVIPATKSGKVSKYGKAIGRLRYMNFNVHAGKRIRPPITNRSRYCQNQKRNSQDHLHSF